MTLKSQVRNRELVPSSVVSIMEEPLAERQKGAMPCGKDLTSGCLSILVMCNITCYNLPS